MEDVVTVSELDRVSSGVSVGDPVEVLLGEASWERVTDVVSVGVDDFVMDISSDDELVGTGVMVRLLVVVPDSDADGRSAVSEPEGESDIL